MNKYFLSLSLLTVSFGASAMDSENSSSSSRAQTSSQSVVGAMQNKAQLSPEFIMARFSNPDELLPYLKDLIGYAFIDCDGRYYGAAIKSDYDPSDTPSSIQASCLDNIYLAHLFLGNGASTFSDPKKCFERIKDLYDEQKKNQTKNQEASSSK